MPRHAIKQLTLCLSFMSVCGCGGSSPAPTVNPSGSDAVKPQTANQGGGQPAASTASNKNKIRRQNERWTDADGREYLGDVPLDVFFDRPFAIAADTTGVGSPPQTAGNPTTQMPTTNMGSGAAPEPQKAPPETVSADGPQWGEMVPLDILKAEVTEIRNFLNQALQSVGSYNSSMLMIPPKAAALASLATISADHPEAVSWKEDAAYIRDLAKQMNESTLQRGKKDRDRLLTLFENMTDIFNRSPPADLAEPPAEDSFADVAEMGYLMMRMDAAEKKMKTEAGSESAFGSKKDMINHEAALLATLTKITTLEGYGYEEDEEFRGYANKIVEAAMAIKEATAANDFNSYELALSKISTSCQECHSVYRNN